MKRVEDAIIYVKLIMNEIPTLLRSLKHPAGRFFGTCRTILRTKSE